MFAADVGAVLGEIQIAEDSIGRTLGNKGQSFLDGGGAVYLQAASGEAFGEQAAETFFIVQDKNGTPFEEIEIGDGRRACAGGRGIGGRHWANFHVDSGEIDDEREAAGRKTLGFNRAAVFPNDRETDTEAEAGATAGTLGGVKRIEKALEIIGADADAVILKGDGDAGADASEADPDTAGFADFANGLFGVGDQIQEDLNELIGVGDDAGNRAEGGNRLRRCCGGGSVREAEECGQ